MVASSIPGRRAIILRWVTVFGRQTTSHFIKPPRPTQPPILRGTGNEYRRKCGDAQAISANRSQPLVGRSSPYCEDMWRRYCCLTSFFPIVDTCLSCEDIARQSCAMVRRWQIFASYIFSQLCVQHISDLHSKFALPHDYVSLAWLSEATRQISTGFASWLRYCTDVAQRRSTKLCTMFGRLLCWYTMYT